MRARDAYLATSWRTWIMVARPIRKAFVLVAVLAVALLLAAPVAAQVPGSPEDIPLPDPASMHPSIPGAPCTVDTEEEAFYFGLEVGDVRYPDVCKRFTAAFGPILVKPGENDALIEPVTIEKPNYDGYMLRFRPNLVRASDGEAPPTDIMHLHHATWLALRSPDGNYGSGPLFAAGEEKTIMLLPEGYGQPVSANDVWGLLYMVHNEVATPEVVWLTYELDVIPAGHAEEAGILPAKQIWLDVQNSRVHPEAPNTGSNPVFNVQRGFGGPDPDTGRQVCAWPKENCARYDVYDQQSPNQGQTEDADGNPIVIHGNDSVRVPARLEGTLVVAGGHTHPGGIRDEVSLVRDGVEKPIFYSDALYWDWDDPTKVGGPPWSWNFSMTGTAPDWRVDIKEGDVIRINAVVDAEDASWYEGMGIVMAWVATEGTHGEPTVDVFEDDVIFDHGAASSVLLPEGPYDPATGWRPERCDMDLSGESGPKRLCLRGGPTHGHLEESGNFSGGSRGCDDGRCPEIATEAPDGRITDEIVSVGFTYGNADMGTISALGIPLLKKGEPARFWNADTTGRIWHTFTRCALPCTGPTDMAYPIADGGSGDPDDHMDFDSAEIGYGTMFEPANGQVPNSSGKSPDQIARDGLFWEFTPDEEGVYAFYCRIHHNMRGAFKVIE
jgi:hypothetical protein